jgi:hypothetical protein
VIQSDNKTAQAKNSVVSTFLAFLVAMGYFSTATLNFLVVGHTHEDVDRLFAMISLLVLRPKNWEARADMVKLITEAFRPMSTPKKEELIVEEVEHIRDFDIWLGGLGIQLHNAFVTRNGREASHAFTYKVRSDLTMAGVNSIPRRRQRIEQREEDVFAIVKGRMHMATTQPPVLALPHCLLSGVQGRQLPQVKQAWNMPVYRKKELEKLAERLDARSDEPCPKAADCIRKLLETPAAPPETAPVFEWLSQPARAREPVAKTSNQYSEHLPDTAWRLLASFRRSAVQA